MHDCPVPEHSKTNNIKYNICDNGTKTDLADDSDFQINQKTDF